jgi:hypothetical protein
MNPILRALSRLGARLGNWNDRRHGDDTPAERGRLWRPLDWIAGRLYVLGDRADQRARADRISGRWP